MAITIVSTPLTDRSGAAFNVGGMMYASALAKPVVLLINNGSDVPVEASEANPLPVTATLRGTWTDRSGTVTTGGTANLPIAANASRLRFFLQNNSAGDLWFNFTTTAVIGQPSIKLAAGEKYEMTGTVSTEAISIIGATGGQAFTCKEL